MKQRIFKLSILLLLLSACTSGTTQAPTIVPSTTPHPTQPLALPTATELPTATTPPTPESVNSSVIEGWALLADKNDYSDVDMTDLPMDYINIKRTRQVLLDAGWQESHILEVLEFDQDTLHQGLNWIVEQADENDLVFVYISSHGLYLHQNVHWGDFILMDWIRIKSAQRVLVLECCRAGAFTPELKYDPKPYIAIGGVGKDEDGWAGLEEEGLPIIGSVFTFYFTAAFNDPEADSDGDGAISIQEAAKYAEDHQRTYMHEVVFEAPEYLEMYKVAGLDIEDPDYPHVVIDDTIGSPVILSSVSQ
jgi:hypothetical protein